VTVKSPRPASEHAPRRLRLLPPSLLALIVFLGATPPLAAATQELTGEAMALHDRCVALARANPKEALDKASAWKAQGGGFGADHCIAMAFFEMGEFRKAAIQFEELAERMMQMPAIHRAQTLDQAGQSWLDADNPERARADFDAAIALAGEDPDLLIDRAEAFAQEKRYWEALDDLNRTIEIAPKRADAYIYRGSAYRAVDSLDLALEDVEHGLKLAPDNVLGLLERGNLRRLKGDAAGAKQDWLRVTELAPNSRAAAAAKTNLARLEEKPTITKKKKAPAQ
jgi:tetratricopeptide (TPR) repeat protein